MACNQNQNYHGVAREGAEEVVVLAELVQLHLGTQMTIALSIIVK